MAACRALVAGIAIALGLALHAQADALASANAKIARLEHHLLPRGKVITFTGTELLAFAQEQGELAAPGAVRNLTLTLTDGEADVSALLNLERVRHAEGHDDNWLTRQLLDGECPFRVKLRLSSSNARAKIDVERLEIAGVNVEGKTLDFLLREFVLPSFPDAIVGTWFPLKDGIDRLEIRPGLVRVVGGEAPQLK